MANVVSTALAVAFSKTLGALGYGRSAATSEGFIPFSWPLNYWQCGRNPHGVTGPNAAVEACASAISQTVAMMPCDHWRGTDDGGRERVLTSPAHRVLRRPNSYQTRAEFMVNLLRSELFQGNGYAYARRDARYQVYELHGLPPRSVCAYIAPEDGAIFYQIGGNPVLDGELDGEYEFDPARVVPQRDVLHVRLHATRNPLVGETPLSAATAAIAAGNAIAGHNATFFSNMSRPSGVLQTDKDLMPATVQDLRARWLEATTADQTGGTPFLSHGLKWQQTTMTAADAALIDSYKLTVADIARVFRVPLAVIGDTTGSTYNNTETLIRHWISTGLGYVIEHLEAAFDDLFKLPDGEWIEFDTDYLLRSEFQSRIDGLTKGIGGGLFAPNEARAREGLPAVTGGDTVYVQQQLQRLEDRAQNIPLDAGRVPAPAPAAPAEPAPPPQPTAAQQNAFAAFLTKVAHGPPVA